METSFPSLKHEQAKHNIEDFVLQAFLFYLKSKQNPVLQLIQNRAIIKH